MDDMTAFQRDILYVVAGLEEPHGLAIKEEIESYYEKEIHHGRLYPNLNDLVDFRFVDKGTHDKRTNCYTITEEGKSALDQRAEWEHQYYKPNSSNTTEVIGD